MNNAIYWVPETGRYLDTSLYEPTAAFHLLRACPRAICVVNAVLIDGDIYAKESDGRLVLLHATGLKATAR